MSNLQSRATVKSELDRLTLEFFRLVSFTPGSAPDYQHIHTLFAEQGLLIKNVGPTPEISTVPQFIAPRHESVRVGDLTDFHESELSETTDRPMTLVTVPVADLEATLARVASAGGSIVEPRMPIPGIGWYATCAEPGGLKFGLIQADASARQV